MSDEKTEAGETLAGMNRQMAEVLADLPRRRRAVLAEVLAEVTEEVDAQERLYPERYAISPDVTQETLSVRNNVEDVLRRNVASGIAVLVNLALSRGAGIPVGQPPATAESLGDVP